MADIKIITEKECCTCKRQQRIDGKAWIYCPIYIYDMLELDGFDETGETQGCSEHEGAGPLPHELEESHLRREINRFQRHYR